MSVDYKRELQALIDLLVNEKASDMHFAVDSHPLIRVAGALISPLKKPILTEHDVAAFAKVMMRDDQFERLSTRQEVDFSFENTQSVRFRGNGFFQRGKMSIALRLIPNVIKTIEDPIEYLYQEEKALIDQREVGIDTVSFQSALNAAFRQDVDVILVGEMRNAETIATAVTAAETGHLVYSTPHTNDAAQTINRIIDSFPGDRQAQIRVQLSSSLIAIFSQRLIPHISGGLVPAYELLINNTAVSNLIRENRVHEIPSIIEIGLDQGMIDMNRSLARLVQNGDITVENAFTYSTNPKGLERLI